MKQLPKYEPIFIVDNRLALPARLGNLEFKAKEGITVACPGKKNALESFKNKEELSVSCQGSEKLQAGGDGYAVGQLGCVKSVSTNEIDLRFRLICSRPGKLTIRDKAIKMEFLIACSNRYFVVSFLTIRNNMMTIFL